MKIDATTLLGYLIAIAVVAGNAWDRYKTKKSRRVPEATANLESALAASEKAKAAAEAVAIERLAAIERMQDRLKHLQEAVVEAERRPDYRAVHQLVETLTEHLGHYFKENAREHEEQDRLIQKQTSALEAMTSQQGKAARILDRLAKDLGVENGR